VLDLPLTADGAIELDALTPGEVRVAAEIDAWREDPLVVGEPSACCARSSAPRSRSTSRPRCCWSCFSVVLDVPAGGRDDCELVLDAPVELLVLVVDDATGEAVSTDQLNWNPRRPEAR
jgi:hypothetical protein